MDMSTVYKALPLDIFEDILDRFKRQQACKKSCMVEYMTCELNHYECYRDCPWTQFVLTNEEANNPDEQKSLDYCIEVRMNGILRDLRYTFYPMQEDEFYNTDSEYADYPYDWEIQGWDDE